MTLARKIMIVMGGTLAGGLAIAAVEAIGHSAVVGDTVFAVAVFGYGLGALIGSAFAAYFADRQAAVLISLILACLALVNLFAFPHPIWFVPAAAIALAVGCIAGLRFSARLNATDSEAHPR